MPVSQEIRPPPQEMRIPFSRGAIFLKISSPGGRPYDIRPHLGISPFLLDFCLNFKNIKNGLKKSIEYVTK